MQYETAVNVLEVLNDPNVEQLFTAYLTLDVHEIKKRAGQCLEEIDFTSLDTEDAEDLFHQASMVHFILCSLRTKS